MHAPAGILAGGRRHVNPEVFIVLLVWYSSGKQRDIPAGTGGGTGR
jgi:hypothetical protein